eukprot:g27187.t1
MPGVPVVDRKLPFDNALRHEVPFPESSADGLWRFDAVTASSLGSDPKPMAASGLRSSDTVKRLLRRSHSASNISIPLATAGNPAPGSRGCENGALMGNFGMFIQGLLGVVAFSLLM